MGYVFGVVLLISVRLAQQVRTFDLVQFLGDLAASQPFVLALLVFTGCLLCPLGNLVAFHCYLIATNTTTNEEITNPYGRRNPFSLGFSRNWRQFLFTPKEPTLIS